MEISKMILMTILALTATIISGCTVIEDIFEAGFWVGLVAAIIVILVIWAIVKIIKAIGK
jgi:uncharacterized membrane protein YcjF (UPF0283 family)